ncbi:(2Fe-2S)-binding protein [Gynuella sunshinyii]|uniref:Bacterioferritin-associated ferredoxin n=1 Tax=Gynuella sunshinyii YC6258 TaxID=1445510 RepID=A0A0C5VHD7_9GAMM|nr:(2Fe-2S)-binding protein [Gynuella sunshinyii]AJQ94077.1 bacterioferritin-associated ferredoxin [Gynuella sunshinyii YC6258]
MYICICENVTERQLRAEVRNGACSLSQARRVCGVARRCGVCARQARLIILEEQHRAATSVIAAAG